MKKIITALVVVVVMSWNVLPGYAAQASASATATIISPVSVISDPSSDNTVQVSDDDSASYSVTLMPSENGAPEVTVEFE